MSGPSPSPSYEDLVARALGALPPAEAKAVDAAIAADREARRAYEAASAHLLLYDGLLSGAEGTAGGAPPPPPFSSVASRLDEPAKQGPRTWGRLYRAAAAAVAAAALVAVVLWSKESEAVRVRVVPDVASVVRVERGGVAVPVAEARSGDRLVATASTSLRVGERARVGVDDATRLRLLSDAEVAVEAGRAEFEVSHAPPAADGSVAKGAPAVVFTVRTPSVTVEVHGTRFYVEVFPPEVLPVEVFPPASSERGGAPAPAARALVAVLDGVVSANGVAVRTGERLLFVGTQPWPLTSNALAVSLEGPEAADAPPRAGGPVEVRLVLENRSDAPAALPPRDAVGSPWFVEVVDPSGARVPYRVTKEMLPDADGAPSIVPPRGRIALTVRFARAFPTAGTYRLKASLGPTGSVSSPVSQDLVLDVR